MIDTAMVIFEETKLEGDFIIKPERKEDERGAHINALFSKEEFRAHRINSTIVQCDVSCVKKKRHHQGSAFSNPPFEEVKISGVVTEPF